MKIRELSILFCSLAIALPAFAQEQEKAPAPAPAKEKMQCPIKIKARILKKYDKDGDGKLNDEERAELLKDPSVQKSLNCVMDSLRNRPWPPPRKFYRKAHRMGPVLPSHPGAMKGPRLAPPPPPAKCPQCGAPVPPPPPAE